MCSSTALVALVLAAGQFFLLANAHVEMMSPIPFRSKYLPNPGPDTDYSMTSPLNQDGSNFPCKGYQNDSLAPTATLTAGSSFMLALDGSATHNGGSCQLSMSYDGGQTWVVFYSIVGGCPIDTENYTIPVPSDLPPSARALLAWSWENNTGNREFYMNCAPVEVVGTTGSTFTGPAMYEANVFGGTNCITPAEVDVVYPNPGQYVHYGGKYVGGNTGPPTVLTPCPFNEAVNITTNGDGTSSSASPATNSTVPVSDPVSSEAVSSVMTVMSSSAVAPDATTAAADPTTPAAADPVTTAAEQPDTTGASASTTLTSTTVITTTGTIVVTMSGFATVTTTPVSNPTTPPGTGAITPPATASNSTDSGQAGAACSPDGSIVCASDGQHWFMCDNGILMDMGSVASGTTCSNGQITRKRGFPPQLWRRTGYKRWV